MYHICIYVSTRNLKTTSFLNIQAFPLKTRISSQVGYLSPYVKCKGLLSMKKNGYGGHLVFQSEAKIFKSKHHGLVDCSMETFRSKKQERDTFVKKPFEAGDGKLLICCPKYY